MLIDLKFLGRSKNKLLSKLVIIIPFSFTFLNCIFGFCSILRSFEGDYKNAALFIMLAALADALDGRLARRFGSTSCLGTQLDSLCDAVSFCLAPALLVYSSYRFQYVISFVNLVFLMLYVCCGLYRLAKFNLEGCMYDTYFKGLPTTIAALLVALFYFYTLADGELALPYWYMNIVLFGLSYLMLSSCKFYSFKKAKFDRYIRNIGFRKVGVMFLLIMIFFLYLYALPLYMLIAYIMGNILYRFTGVISNKMR